MLPEFLSDIRYRARALFGRAEVERELDAELRFHLDTEVERLVRDGVPIAEARRQARLSLGATEHIKETSRDARGVRGLENLWRDVSHAFRLAVRQPGFSAVVVLSLALGIGASAAVFNLTYDVLFTPIRVSHPEQLYELQRAEKEAVSDRFTWREAEALRSTSGLGAFTTYRTASAILMQAGEFRDYTNLHFVEGNFFSFLGVKPLRGRLITPDDDAKGSPVIALAQWYAERLFPADTSVVGKTVTLRGAAFTVIGVTPRRFRGVDFPGWFIGAIPEGSVGQLGSGRDDRGQQYGAVPTRASDSRAFVVVGRAQAQMNAADGALAATFKRCCAEGEHANDRLRLANIERGIEGGKNDFRSTTKRILPVLSVGMLLVLIVVCCNIASLLLVRGAARQREIAVRLSLGASRVRLASQLVIESVPHALLGGVGGAMFGAWYLSAFVHALPADLAAVGDIGEIFGFQLGPTLVFTIGLALASSVGFSLYPALRATKQQLAQTLRLDTRSSRSRKQGAIARGVVVAQVAVTAVLITAAALMSSTLSNISTADGGFATDRMLIANIEARSTKYEAAGVQGVQADIVRAVSAVRGVEGASASTAVPLFGGTTWQVAAGVPGNETTPDRAPQVPAIAVTPGHFATLGMHVTAGRDFGVNDAAKSERVAIVNNAFVAKYYEGRGVIDRLIGFTLDSARFTSARIVGVVSDAKYDNLREALTPRVYVPMSQLPGVWRGVQLVVRTQGDPSLVVRGVTKAVDAAAPGIGFRKLQTMEATRETSTVLDRIAARLAEFISLMALLLSAVGLYGVVAYSVSRRTSEIGVRIALGARAAAILWLVARETIMLVGIGVLVGIPLSLAANGAIRSALFGVSPRDPFAALAAVSLLAAIGLIASIVPARRATRIDPKTALGAD